MKFTDGMWLSLPGVKSLSPISVYDVEINAENKITIYAPTRWINHRAATHDCALLSIELFSPMTNVIGVKIYHHQGRLDKGPNFQLNLQPDTDVKIVNSQELVSLQSGSLRVEATKDSEFNLRFFREDHLLTESSHGSTAYIEKDGKPFMREQLDLAVGECIYGLGERFTAFVKNGQSVDIWNCDGGTGSEQAYKNIPFYLTNRGYGVLVNHPDKVSYEIASERVSKAQFSVPGECLEYYIINGPDPKDVLTRYTALAGRPSLPPAWSFGLWLTTSFTTDYDEQTVTEFIDGMAKRDIPLTVFHFDCFWMKEYHWCNFVWDERVFPDPPAMLRHLKERDLKICVWINPYIAQRSHLFNEGKQKGYFLTKPNGDIWQWDRWQAGMAVVDFTNPDACTWYKSKLRQLLEMGVDCFKTDFGERIPTDVIFYGGTDPAKMHNYYTYLYNRTVFELLREVKGESEAVVFARSATVGSQKYPVHWGGDCAATYASMAESLRGGLSLSLSGFGFWSHDIGGFESTATPALYKRWTAFGLLSSHSRLHGNTSYRVPWLFDQEAVDVMRKFTKLKCQLMPYIYKTAIEATDKGIPVMRAMMLEFPDDPGCASLDRQYMLGESLLVAPIFNDAGDVDYYLPKGDWVNFLTNKVIKGYRWLQEKHDFFSLPLLMRPNSLIAVGSSENTPDYDYAQDVTLHLSALADGSKAETEVFDSHKQLQLKATVTREAGRLVAMAQTVSKPWQLLLRTIDNVKQVENGDVQATSLGILIKPHDYTQKVVIYLT